METSVQDSEPNILILGSYPTYEEWKQYIKQNRLFIKRSSYPTYEEWKHPKNNIIEFF